MKDIFCQLNLQNPFLNHFYLFFKSTRFTDHLSLLVRQTSVTAETRYIHFVVVQMALWDNNVNILLPIYSTYLCKDLK